jgi:hypothetical protein
MGSAHHRSRGFGGTADGKVWEIGVVSLPATAAGEDGIRFRPLVALVMDASGAIRAMAPGHPDRPLEAVKQAIAQARDYPQPPCEPGEPRRVVVDSARLLELVPTLLPGALVSKGATPRLAEAARSFRDHLAEGDGKRGLEAMTTYFTEDVTPEVVRGFFEVAAALYDRRPWQRIPSDGHLVQVTCLPLGVPGWTCCVIGQNRESYGVIIFDSVDDYGRYVEAAERADAGEENAMTTFPSYRAINFEARHAMPKPLLREIEHHDWPVADGDAYPTVMLVEGDASEAPQAPQTRDQPKVPAALRERVESLMARIDPFCAEHLNSDYRDLIHEAVAALARKRPSPLLTGREPSWCAGAVHAIGTTNFLFDSSQSPHCAPKAIYDHFGVAASTALNHSKKIRDLLDIRPFAHRWLLPSLLEESAIPWMLEVNGFMVDVRTLPVEIQAEACAKGLIPSVPALRNQPHLQ